VSQTFIGPPPPPGILAEYQRVLPDLAERIVNRADKEQDFRHDAERQNQALEQRALNVVATKTFCGQAIGVSD
jgi:uncharacterized membrane protein